MTGSITVRGHGIAPVTPDVMRVGIGVSVHRDSVASARADAAATATRVTDALADVGITGRDLQTARFSIHPEYRHTERRRILDGYRVTSSLEVTIRDLERAGDALDAAVAAGGNDIVVDQIAFDIDDGGPAQHRARAAAWRDAESTARQLAELAGVMLGTAVRITEIPAASPPGLPTARAAATEMAMPIEPGVSEVSVLIEVEFATETDG